MRYVFSQMAVFLEHADNKRNMRFILRFSLAILCLIALYTVLFHLIMLLEGRTEYSAVTGLYWTLTVMSTLGFGDITFASDLGKIFTIVVLFSGILLFMLLLPFLFIRLIYQPWLEAHKQALVPQSLPREVQNHVLLVGADDIALNVASRLSDYAIPCYVITGNAAEANVLYDGGIKLMRGDLDSTSTYLKAGARKAAMVVALHGDLRNTNIAATVHEAAPDTLLVSSIDHENSRDILHLAGCKHVFNFAGLLGETMGRRVFAGKLESNIIARFDELCIAEAPVRGTFLVGKNLIELNLRAQFGLNVVGVWQGTEFMSASPQTVIADGAVILLAGTADRIERYDHFIMSGKQDEIADSPALILGGGRVGMAIAGILQKRGIPYRLVDQEASVLKPGDDRFILGDAADLSILRKGGLDHAGSVLITTHNDDLNIYLTIYCRRLRPDAQIISRSNLSRNKMSLYNAGANLVMTSSSMATNALTNLLSPDRIYMLTEGLNVFRLPVSGSLVGSTLRNSAIRETTACNVVAMQRGGKMLVNMDPDVPFESTDDLIVIGTEEAEQVFMRKFPPREAGLGA